MDLRRVELLPGEQTEEIILKNATEIKKLLNYTVS